MNGLSGHSWQCLPGLPPHLWPAVPLPPCLHRHPGRWPQALVAIPAILSAAEFFHSWHLASKVTSLSFSRAPCVPVPLSGQPFAPLDSPSQKPPVLLETWVAPL